MIGKFDAWRGFDLALEAFRNAVKREEDIHLTILGSGSEKRYLENLIMQFGLSEYVTLAGEVDIEVYREYMLKSDVVLNPSLKEGAVTIFF